MMKSDSQKSKYILHYGSITGMPYQYARALEKINIPSVNVIPRDSDFGRLNRKLPFDKAISGPDDGRLRHAARRIAFLFDDVIPDAAGIHYYSHTIFKNMLDIRLLSALKKPMLISFAGTDVRITSEAQKNNPYFWQMPYSEGDEAIRRKLKIMGKYIRFAATDYEMGEYVRPYFEKVFVLRQAINISEFVPHYPDKDNRRPVLIHIPTHREFKGTAFIEDAVNRLKEEKHDFEFVLYQPNMTQEQVKHEIYKCDIVIDEIRCGAHGIMALEAMAAGKPIISYIRDDLKAKYPADLPIVSANPDTIYMVLKELIADSNRRHDIGVRGRQYVDKYHSREALGPALWEIYREIGLDL